MIVPAVLLAMAMLSGQALAARGAGSAGSTLGWLNSTTSGVIDVAAGINTLQGGVAKGMAQALANARPWDTLQKNAAP